MHNKSGPQRLVGEVQIFRIRVATAESKLKVLREQARQARRRRKEAKQIAQRARKQFKRGKANLAELKKSLAKAEAKLFEAGGRALAKKMDRRKRARKTGDHTTRRAKAPASKPRAALSREPRAPRRDTRKQPAITEAPVVPAVPTDVAPTDHSLSSPQIPDSNS